MNDLEKPKYITLKPLALQLGVPHRKLEKIIVDQYRKGNFAPRYQISNTRSYIYIFDEFLTWFQTLLVIPKVKNKKPNGPVDLFKQQRKQKLNGARYENY